MKRQVLGVLAAFILTFSPTSAKADLFGGDVAVLAQILVQAVQQLEALRSLLGSAKENVDLIRRINEGINDSLRLLNTIEPNLDPGVYREWATVQDALGRLRKLYGDVVESPEAQIQKDTDQGIAEAVTFNNSFYKYTRELDEVGERIKFESHNVSPGGAAKLTAQALGLMIQVMNQNLRAQATSLKLQGQAMAIQNHQDKLATKRLLDTSKRLETSMKAEKATFQIPRF